MAVNNQQTWNIIIKECFTFGKNDIQCELKQLTINQINDVVPQQTAIFNNSPKYKLFLSLHVNYISTSRLSQHIQTEEKFTYSWVSVPSLLLDAAWLYLLTRSVNFSHSIRQIPVHRAAYVQHARTHAHTHTHTHTHTRTHRHTEEHSNTTYPKHW